MSIFKRKNSLKTRIRSIESFLGIFYAEDGWGDLEHKLEADGYTILHKLQEDVKAIKEQLNKGKK